jgi:membrane protein DedA with SNARE-associated domain
MIEAHPILDYLANLPPFLTYILMGAGAAIENIFPPVPADTFVLLGAFLSARGRANGWYVFLATWAANVAGALLVYGLARKWGQAFFSRRPGRWLLRPGQLMRIARFYDEWGTVAILMSRFLPGFRAVVPVFSGTSGLTLLRVAVPMAIASAIWYGALIAIGLRAGQNFDRILGVFRDTSAILTAFAVVLGILSGIWWWKSRRQE